MSKDAALFNCQKQNQRNIKTVFWEIISTVCGRNNFKWLAFCLKRKHKKLWGKEHMAVLIIRTFLLYFTVLFALKILGKRQIGELQPIELIVMLIISEMASLYMQSNDVPLINSLLLIGVLCVLQLTLTLINLRSEKWRHVFCGHPSVIIKEGLVQENEMRKQRMNLNDLIAQLRSQGYFCIFDIYYALMETNGEISVLPKKNKQPLTVGDMGLKCVSGDEAKIFIMDGVINRNNLAVSGRDEGWLINILKQHNISDYRKLFLAGMDGGGHFKYQYKEGALDEKA
jgi:uncharacterized membrane protein YcaP (DUF421 family)